MLTRSCADKCTYTKLGRVLPPLAFGCVRIVVRTAKRFQAGVTI